MPHPAAQAIPILTVAAALGLEVSGRKARCFNGVAHRSGTDETPALVFQTDVNRFKCYACGVKGDAIDLVRAIKAVPFPVAVEFLEALAATGPPPDLPGYLRKAAGPRMPDDEAMRIYASLLELAVMPTPGSPGGRYLRGRGIDVDLAGRHHAVELLQPYAAWESLAARHDDQQLRAAGLVSRGGNFLFARHPLLFVYVADGRPRYLQARDIAGGARCKELSLGGLSSPVPFNVDALRRRPGRVLVCEGCIDTLSAAQLGHAAVGVPGATGFRDDWFPLFGDAHEVTVLFDDDDAGRLHAGELRARFRWRGFVADAQFPRHGKDVNDLLRSLPPGAMP